MKRLFLIALSLVLVVVLAESSQAYEITLDDFTGDDAQVILDITGEGTNEVTFDVSLGAGTIADIRGIFFDYEGDLTNVSVAGPHVTDWDFSGNVSNLGGGAVIKPMSFDAGVEIGTQGIGRDDISSTSFTLTADEIINFEAFGARLMSVGPNRRGSSKLTIIPPPLDPIPEPATVFLFGVGLLGVLGLGRKIKK